MSPEPRPFASSGKRPFRAFGWLAAVALAAALQPMASVLWQAHAQESDPQAEQDPRVLKKKTLAAMTSNEAALINVTDREMPASPDILNLGKRSTKALERCLADNVDPSLRSLCATLLGKLGDRRALPTLQAALDDWEAPVRLAVIHALRRIPDRSSYEPLLKIYQRKDEEATNRQAVLETFGALSEPKAVNFLRKKLRAQEDDDLNPRPQAFAAIWASRHLMAPNTLVGDVAYALRSSDTQVQLAATVAAAELRSPQLVQPLIPLMDAPDAHIRNKAVYALGRIGDKKATAALLAKVPQVREARMLNNIAFALERLDREAFFPAIQKLLEHKQAAIRLNAAFVVGDVRRPEGLPLLKKALEDPSDYVKTSAIVALGKLGTADAMAPLEKYIEDPSLSVREEAIYALQALSGQKKNDLIYQKLFQSSNDAVKRRAAIALGQAKDPRAREYLLGCLENRRCSLPEVEDYLKADKDPSVPGRILLAWARGQTRLTPLVEELHPAGSLPIAQSALDAALAREDIRQAKLATDLVGDLGDPSAKARIERSLNNTDTWLRIHTAVAMARLGEASADTVILRDLDNLAAFWLPEFVDVVSKIEEPAVRARLLPELLKRQKGADADIAMASAAIQLAWDPDTAIFRLLEGLSAPTTHERELAEAYLKDNKAERVTWLLRRALARETRPHTTDRLRKLLDLR